MGIPEPVGLLWAAVKAINDPWPPDDESVAWTVSVAWRQGADVMAWSAADAADAGAAVQTAWPDLAGSAFDGRLGQFGQAMGQARDRAMTLARQGEVYAGELESAKTAIRDTIAVNEANFRRLSEPQFFPVNVPYQQAFATAISNYLQDMIQGKAAALRANPLQPGPVPPPAPQLPPVVPESYGLDDLGADAVRTWGDFDQFVWRNVGDAADSLYEDVGAGVGGAVSGVGNLVGNGDIVQAGEDFQSGAEAEGDRVGEEFLAVGSDNQAQIYDAAEGIDGDKEPTTVYINADRYPESASHIDDAQGGTSYRGAEDTAYEKQQPSELTVNRGGADDNRSESLRGVPTESGKDRDEYPPATFSEGGKGASVKNIPLSDNRGSGSSMGHQLRRQVVEDSYGRQTRRVEDNERVIIETYTPVL